MKIQQMTLGQKIAAGYILLLGITIGLGLMALWNMWNGASRANLLSSQYLPEASIAASVQEMALTANLNARSYALTGEKDYLDRFNSSLEKIQSGLRDAEQLTAQSSSPDQLREQITKLDNKLSAYRRTMDATVDNQRARARAWESVNAAATSAQSSLDDWRKNQNTALREILSSNTSSAKTQELLQRTTLLGTLTNDLHQIQLATIKAQAGRHHSTLNETHRCFDAASAHLAQIEALTHEPDQRQILSLLRGQIITYRESVAGLHKCYQETDAIDQSRLSAANEFIAAAKAVMESEFQSTVTTAKTSTATLSTASGALMIGLVVSILAGAVLSFLITRGITATVRAIIQSLSTSSEQTASAAGEISQASQSLAESSSEQAASLEQTSASLEQMAGMTKLNADNAAKAKDLADETRGAADSGSEDMRAMMSAMDDIKCASDGIAKIIKTIDEIAFQTNILALNAAVEAARAGDSGLGFAVVADEVRSLAQRSATAAKETAQHIEEAITKSERGVLISSKVAQSLQHIVAKAHEVDTIIAEIATASKEQSRGIDQVNIAVEQMDKVTQSNAANAEQTASASEELSAQSQELQSAVHHLLTMVGGHAAPDAGPVDRKTLTTATQRNLFNASGQQLPTHTSAQRTTGLLRTDPARHHQPDNIIPLKRYFKHN